MAKRITLRSNTSNNTGKGAKMTHAEMDANLESFFVSSSFDGTNLYLHSTGSVNTDTIDLSGLAALGAQGTTGAQGTAGTGTQGTQGIQGTEGTGIQGTDGTQGTQGIAGGASSQGIQGTQGIQGLEGTGLQGIQGTEGTGIQGIQGTLGLQGADGGASSQGTQGTQGTQGLEGTGLQGAQGTEGTGTQGIQGTRGLQGIQGLTGIGTQGTSGVLSTAKTLGSSSETLGDHTDGTTHTVQSSWTRLAPAGGSFTNASGGTKSYLVVLGLEMTSTYTQSGIVPFGIDIKFADIASGAIVYTEWRDTVFMSYASEVASRVTKTYVSHAFQLDNGADFAVYVKGTPYLAQQLYIQYSLLTVTELTGTAVGTLN